MGYDNECDGGDEEDRGDESELDNDDEDGDGSDAAAADDDRVGGDAGLGSGGVNVSRRRHESQLKHKRDGGLQFTPTSTSKLAFNSTDDIDVAGDADAEYRENISIATVISRKTIGKPHKNLHEQRW